eukprot:CAMPEP_0119008406 /NCGR_PEP_ID=MMETSP1176-20130426/3669_1 /TAXON_ID=265551 /ORGANISM="Synedropsis recta cf, Strain CCMP1620" /LENGTH=558 /DNA_ID=CAMNT_0006960729 /DNA_START=77 /DNA_END=1753 /DNA_ORIENTATION=-
MATETAPPPLSKNEQKRAKRKQEKARKVKLEFTRLLLESGTNPNTTDGSRINTTTNSSGAGKASRSRRAQRGEVAVGSSANHRPCGGAPVNVLPNHEEVVLGLDEFETLARIKFRPAMLQRKLVVTDNHGTMEQIPTTSENCAVPVEQTILRVDSNTGVCSFSECNLRSFSISQIPLTVGVTLGLITNLNLSRNEIWNLPDLSGLANVATLDLSRNWFRDIPESISTLQNLSSLLFRHNMLTSSRDSLKIDALKTLPKLAFLDLSCNKRCGHQDCAELLRKEIPQLEELKMTITCPRPEGTFVGATPAERDATLLRSQLEPWSTSALRHRLVADFGMDAPGEDMNRSEVMSQLLKLYKEEGNARTVVKVEGIPIDETLVKELLVALRSWSDEAIGGNQERRSINAKNYMILTAPAELDIGSKNAYKAVLKLSAHKLIWDLAQKAMMSVDPDFAKNYTALAVTHGFHGSPHIDRQNIGPFYGLSLGNFEEGTGGICVECSARIVASVNTKNRLAKVDGRNPHWVAPYDLQTERHSLIFYQTAGEREPVGPAIFQIPVIA